MDKTERETHDFMKVDSFSELPFIRPAPPAKEKGIRLFGIEFPDGAPIAADESYSTETITTDNAFELDANYKDTENGENSSRRFECHYCCRNFPTSQALGGHQNAHKRERQHAKRAHLQSAMVHSSLSDPQVYDLMNYRFGSAPTTAMAYPTSWNSNNSSSAMIGGGTFYGSSYAHHHHHRQLPINGSHLALWRIPAEAAATGGDTVQSNPIFNRERSLHPLPLFAGEEMMNTRMGASRVTPSVVSQNRYVFDSKPSVSDPVSLDLHL